MWSQSRYSISNENGFFQIELDQGTFLIKVDYIGHIGESIEVTLNKNEEALIIFELGTEVVNK